ncbi:Hypothetical predicted protein [Mytilus galloprovincialis]|uniref:Uncharacterized protein n=1 Tax=Mytilus galloprovincialis TaxID=29158 RepID=A0A8B6FFF1_MYTGA|nr:Hypothetical predicted protein [Mytilus galloprovincialis]
MNDLKAPNENNNLMEYSKMVVTGFCLNVVLIGMAISTTEAIYSTHQNVSVGRFKNTSMCGVFALTQDEKTFHISSDAHHIDPPCSLYLIGVNIINNNYSLSGMCYKFSDIALPCGRNDILILREWDLILATKISQYYCMQIKLVTEKTLRCDSNQDFTMNYEFCRKKLSMIEILFYSPNNPSSVLPKITVQSRVLIGPTYPPLSLYDMETMKIQMDECKTCKVTAHQMYLDFLDRVILIGNNNNNNKNEDKNEEETSSASVDLNILLPSLFGSIATVAVAVVAAWQAKKTKFCSAEENSNTAGNGQPSVIKDSAIENSNTAGNGQTCVINDSAIENSNTAGNGQTSVINDSAIENSNTAGNGQPSVKKDSAIENSNTAGNGQTSVKNDSAIENSNTAGNGQTSVKNDGALDNDAKATNEQVGFKSTQ